MSRLAVLALIARINEMEMIRQNRERERDRANEPCDTACNEFFIKNGKPLIDMSDVLARWTNIALRFARISIFNDSRPCLRFAAVTIDRGISLSPSLPFCFSHVVSFPSPNSSANLSGLDNLSSLVLSVSGNDILSSILFETLGLTEIFLGRNSISSLVSAQISMFSQLCFTAALRDK